MKWLAALGVVAGLVGMLAGVMAGEWAAVPFAFASACWAGISLMPR